MATAWKHLGSSAASDVCKEQGQVCIKGILFVMQLALQPVQVLPEDSPTNGVLVVLVVKPHPLGIVLF